MKKPRRARPPGSSSLSTPPARISRVRPASPAPGSLPTSRFISPTVMPSTPSSPPSPLPYPTQIPPSAAPKANSNPPRLPLLLPSPARLRLSVVGKRRQRPLSLPSSSHLPRRQYPLKRRPRPHRRVLESPLPRGGQLAFGVRVRRPCRRPSHSYRQHPRRKRHAHGGPRARTTQRLWARMRQQ